MRLKRDKPGDALGRPSWQSSLLRDPGAKFLPQSGGKHEKYNLERMSTSITVQESEFEWPVLNRPQMAGFGVTTEAPHGQGHAIKFREWTTVAYGRICTRQALH
jgi:hypothetical protein